MYALKFDGDLCKTCPTSDCLVKCQYIDIEKDDAREEMVKVFEGKDSFILNECITCYGCEEYCKRGNHPFYLITERREEKGILTSPRAITNQWINIGEPQGKYRLGEIKEKILSFAKYFNLNSGSFDIIKDKKGKYIFLEVNPVGQFGMVSQPCNYNLEQKIAKYLIKISERE